MTFPTFRRHQFASRAFFDEFDLQGKYEPIGTPFISLNDQDRHYAVFKEATISPVGKDYVVEHMKLDDIRILKQQLIAVGLTDETGRETAELMIRKIRMKIYTRQWIIEAYVHLRAEEIPEDVLSVRRHDFFATSEARLSSAKIGESYEYHAKVMFINRDRVLFYHRVEAENGSNGALGGSVPQV
ncbi:MAG: hypothetical protein ABFQ89_00980 [Chloroflexota bacterium]